MARYRSRSRSYSPRRQSMTPPPPHRGRKLYEDEDPRDRRSFRDRRSPAPGPTGLLLRNLPLNARADDIRIPFERFGPVKDVYLPKNYHTGEPRGFGFVKFHYAEDAAEAMQHMNHRIMGGREVRIVFAEENRKTPREMRMTSGPSTRSRGNNRRRSLSRSPTERHRSYSRSRSPARDRRPSNRSPIPRRDGRTSIEETRERDYPLSRSLSPRGNTQHPPKSQSPSYSPL